MKNSLKDKLYAKIDSGYLMKREEVDYILSIINKYESQLGELFGRNEKGKFIREHFEE